MGKINILCYFLGVVFGGVALTLALTVAQDSWRSDQHMKGLIWSSVVAVFVIASAFVGGLPMAMEADANASANAATNTTTKNESDRAWISISSAHLVTPLNVGVNPTVRVEFVNTGKTPAFDVEIAGNVYSRSTSIPLVIDNTTTGERKSKTPLGPGIPYTSFLDSTEVITKQGQIDVLLKGTHTLYATGYVTYKDQSGKQRRTEFCLHTTGQGMNITDATGYVVMAVCSQGNNAT